MAAVIVVGNVNLETTLRIDAFPLPYAPTRFVPGGIQSSVSGVGWNVARALQRLGNRVTLATIVGDDSAASLIRATLAGAGLPPEPVLSLAAKTAQSVVIYDTDGRRAVHTDLGNLLELAYPPEPLLPALADAELAVLTNIAYTKPLLPVMQARRIPIAVDLHTLTDPADPYNLPYLQAAALLFVSGELLTVSPAEWAETLLAASPAELVVIGLGAAGAYLAERGGRRELVPAVTPRPIVQTGGAGDALSAAFLHHWLQQHDALTALQAAVVYAGWKLGAAASSDGLLSGEALAELRAQLQRQRT
jgi:sugar/nucleoside kinase (ribokinase family)